MFSIYWMSNQNVVSLSKVNVYNGSSINSQCLEKNIIINVVYTLYRSSAFCFTCKPSPRTVNFEVLVVFIETVSVQPHNWEALANIVLQFQSCFSVISFGFFYYYYYGETLDTQPPLPHCSLIIIISGSSIHNQGFL